MCLPVVFSLTVIRQHPLGELVSKSQVVILHHAQGQRKGGGGRGRGKGKSDHPPPEHKVSASDGAASSDDLV